MEVLVMVQVDIIWVLAILGENMTDIAEYQIPITASLPAVQ
jgi:hypothetical protein